MKGLETGEWHGFSGVGFFLIPREGASFKPISSIPPRWEIAMQPTWTT